MRKSSTQAKVWNAKSAKNSSVGFENDILVF